MTNGIATTTLNTNNKPGTTEVTATIDNAKVKTSVYVPLVDITVYNNPWEYLDLENEYEYMYSYDNVPVFMLVVHNSAAYDEATGVVVQYIIPNGFQYITSDDQDLGSTNYTYNSTSQDGVLTWNIGYMPKDGWATAYIYLKVIATGDQTPNLTTTASLIHVDQTIRNLANNQNVTCAITVPSSANVQVNQNYTTFTQNNKNYVTYTITVTNNGPDNATWVQITDILPNGVSWISDTSGGAYNHTTTGTNAGIWNIGNLNSGDSVTLTITVQVTATTGTIINTASETNQNEDSWNYNNNAQTTYLTIQ
jgi:uncharacterized repeat protein (TIGR01451 family)